jgi:hypothetical protein
MKLRNTYLLGALALSAAFASCSSDEPAGSINNDSTTPITLDTYVARDVNASRATVETATTLQTSGFYVYGYYLGTDAFASYDYKTPNLFNETKVYYKDDAWTYDNLKYWTKNTGENYRFIAANATATTTNGPKISYDASTSNLDLLTAYKDVTTAETNGVVTFAFAHRTSRLAVNVKTAADYSSNATITITSLKLSGARLKGTYDILNNSWSTSASGDVADFSIVSSNTTISSTYNNLIGSDRYLFAVPNTGNLTLTVSYTVAQGDVTYTYTNQAVPYQNATLEQGKAYNLNLSIGLNAIQFSVESVTDWGNTSDLTGSL